MSYTELRAYNPQINTKTSIGSASSKLTFPEELGGRCWGLLHGPSAAPMGAPWPAEGARCPRLASARPGPARLPEVCVCAMAAWPKILPLPHFGPKSKTQLCCGENRLHPSQPWCGWEARRRCNKRWSQRNPEATGDRNPGDNYKKKNINNN